MQNVYNSIVYKNIFVLLKKKSINGLNETEYNFTKLYF